MQFLFFIIRVQFAPRCNYNTWRVYFPHHGFLSVFLAVLKVFNIKQVLGIMHLLNK